MCPDYSSFREKKAKLIKQSQTYVKLNKKKQKLNFIKKSYKSNQQLLAYHKQIKDQLFSSSGPTENIDEIINQGNPKLDSENNSDLACRDKPFLKSCLQFKGNFESH